MVGLSGLNSGYPWLAYLQGKHPPPLVLPHTLSFPGMGVGGSHLVNTKILLRLTVLLCG